MTTTKTKTDSRWGTGVFVLYGAFVLFILACVGFASLQHFDLVDSGYYEKGIKYQQQIDRIARTQRLADRPRVELNAQEQALVVSFPTLFPPDKTTGSVVLFRPSNSQLDRRYPLQLTAGRTQTIRIAGIAAGQWRVKLEWTCDTLQYYSEDTLFLH